MPGGSASHQSTEEQPPGTLLFLHHFGGSSRTWSEVLERLGRSEPSITCLAPDLRGFGATAPGDSTNGTGYEIDDYADEVSALIERSGAQRYILIGHSMGGKIALSFASRRPSGLLGVLLVAPSPPSPEPMTDQAREQLRRAREDAAIASQVVVSATAKPLSKLILDRTVADILSSAPQAWNAWLDTGSKRDLGTRVSTIDVPVVVLAGGQDPALTPSLLRKEIIERISASRLLVVPDSGHLMPLDAPAAITRHIRDFLRLLTAPQSPVKLKKRALYAPGTVRRLLATDLIGDPTRRVLYERLANFPAEPPVFFDIHQFRTLSAVCARTLPQLAEEETIDIAGEIDMRLNRGEGNGWRYKDLPSDGEAYRIGLKGFDETALNLAGSAFAHASPSEQDAVLFAVQQNRVSGGAWDRISPSRFFEELLAEASEIYFSHPAAQELIGYAGMADNRGWHAIGLNRLDLQEPLPLQPRDA